MKIALVDKERVKAKSFMHEHISEAKLMIAIERVQDSYIQQLLGDVLYKDLQDRKINNTLTAIDNVLINEHLLNCFVIKLEQYIIATYSIDLRNLTIGTVIDGNIRPLTKDDIIFHYQLKERELVTVEKLAIDFINQNYSSVTQVIQQQKNIKTNFDVI